MGQTDRSIMNIFHKHIIAYALEKPGYNCARCMNEKHTKKHKNFNKQSDDILYIYNIHIFPLTFTTPQDTAQNISKCLFR